MEKKASAQSVQTRLTGHNLDQVMAPEKLIHADERVRPPEDSVEPVADGLLTVQECADFLHLSRSKVYEMLDA